jgi:tRNA(Ile)-lysidine synthase
MPPAAGLPPWAGADVGPVRAALAQFAAAHAGLGAADQPVALAFSGGADSTALLVAALQFWGPQRVRALHVHHGLQAAADDFAAHASALCRAWEVPLSVLPVRVAPQSGDSLEDLARQARYAALGAAARDQRCAWLLLAHQADDQAESLLLALLRGAGPKGLAAMPRAVQRHGVWLGRPLLELGAARLRELLDAAGVAYLRDPMNDDPAFRRSRIRHELLPVIARLEPGWARTLSRSAALCALAAQGVEAQAGADLEACTAASSPPDLSLRALRELPAARRAEVLRAWLGRAGVRSNAAQLANLCRQIEASALGAARLRVDLASARVQRRGSLLQLAPRL